MSYFEIDPTGQLIWGGTCLLIAIILIIYDTIIKQSIGIVLVLFIWWLLLHGIHSCLTVINSNTVESITLTYLCAAIVSMAGNLWLIMCTVLLLSPSNKQILIYIITFAIIPIIYFVFLIYLAFIPTQSTEQQFHVSHIYHFICVMFGILTTIILYYWYLRQKFIFSEQDNRLLTNWNIIFIVGLIGIFIAVGFNLTYTSLVNNDIVFDEYPMFTTHIVESIILLPTLTILMRNFDKLYINLCSGKNSMEIITSDQSDDEHEPFTDQI